MRRCLEASTLTLDETFVGSSRFDADRVSPLAVAETMRIECLATISLPRNAE
jgi:hypothetical protein